MASTDAEAHVTWSDSRAGNPDEPAEDAYYTSVMHDRRSPVPTLSVLPVTLGGFGGLVVAGVIVLMVAVTARRGHKPQLSRSTN